MFNFDGTLSTVHGIIVTKDNHLDKAKKNIELIKIPGRTGDLIFDDGSEENLKITIECVVDGVKNKDLAAKMDAIEKWLKKDGYKTLIFIEDNTTFKATLIGELKPKLIAANLAELTIEFSCYKEVG
ncbi:TPA: hypothetical protein I9Z35_002869 [Clostridium perfringens]|nr:hypothetical protein [Clostridium perfringens]